MSKVLVTGSDGFIGSHLVEELVKKGYEVRAFVYYNSFNNWGWIDTFEPEIKDRLEIFLGDVRDPNGVRIAMEGCDADGIIVGIGPHIKSCCFEVGSEVRDVFLDKYGEGSCRESDGRLYVNLEYAIICQFREAGIPAENITVSDLCTHCNADLFYSHRRDRGMTGAMAGMIQKL